MHGVAELLGERERQSLVAAGDARRRLVVDVRDARRGPRPPPGRPCSRTRSPRARGSPRARPPGCRASRGTPRRCPPRCPRRELALRRLHRGAELLVRGADAAPRVAPPVAHPLVPQPEPEAVDQLQDRGVARAGCTPRPSRRRRRSGASATTRAHPRAAAPPAPRPPRRRGQLVGRDEPGEPGADDDGPHAPGVRRSAATRIHRVAPRSWTSTGLSSSSSSPLASSSSPAAAASRAAAATSTAAGRALR